MKKLLTILITLLPFLAFSQYTTTIVDTVCYQTSGSIYFVDSTICPTCSYTWLQNGVTLPGQNAYINVDWSNAVPGSIPSGISVFATDPITGCISPIVTVDILIYNVVVNINAVADMCENDCVPLTATPIGGVWSGTGVIGNTFCPPGDGQFNITYTVTNDGCTFTDIVTINVIPQPILGPINHN